MKNTFLFSIFLASLMSQSHAFLSSDVPTCQSKDARKLMIEILQDNDEQFLDIKNIQELGFNKAMKIRMCSGLLSIVGSGSEDIEYQISLDKDNTDYFYLEIL